METLIENPKLDVETLSVLKDKIGTNTAKIDDYKKLDYFLSIFNSKNFILEQLEKYDIHSYEEYILEREKKFYIRNKHVNGAILGVIRGAISALEKYITNTIHF